MNILSIINSFIKEGVIMSLPDNLDYLFYKKYYKKYSREELMDHYCDRICDDLININMCQNCKKHYQEWKLNYIFKENELQEFKLSYKDYEDDGITEEEWMEDNDEDDLKFWFFMKKWQEAKLFFKEPIKCDNVCSSNENSDFCCSPCKSFKVNYHPEIKKFGFCQICFEEYVKEKKYNKLYIIYPEDMVCLTQKQIGLKNCLKCQDMVCSHYMNEDNQNCDHCNFVNFINKRYQLDKYVVNLIQHLELKYMPCGEGALEALKSFNSSIEKNDN